MKYILWTVVFSLSVAIAACATDEPRHASPPPGSHSPFSAPDERDGVGAERDRPALDEEPDQEEEEPEEPVERQ